LAATPRFRVRRYELKGGDFAVTVLAPIPCTYFSWRNAGQFIVKIDTPPYDETSYSDLSPGVQNVVTAYPAGPHELLPRFNEGDELCRLSLLDDTDPTHISVCEVQFVF
jgi:hypothetical protein